MKKILSLVLCIVMLFRVSIPVMATPKEQPIKVKLCNYVNPDGKWVAEKYIKFDVNPIIVDGRTMVPIRAIAEELGWKVTWEQNDSNSGGWVRLNRNVPTGFDFEKNPQLLAYVYNMRKYIDGKDYSNTGNEVKYIEDSGGLFTDIMKGPYNIDDVLYSGLQINFRTNIYVTPEDTDGFGSVPSFFKKRPYLNDFYICLFNEKNWQDTDTIMSRTFSFGVSGDVHPQIINGRTLIPLRQLSEAMGLTVSWDNATRTVTITA